MTEAWIRCDDLDVAAAFGTIGVPMRRTVQVRSDNGREYITVFLALKSHTNPALPETKQLMMMLKDGSLLKTDPEHPLLYALEAVKNRHLLGETVKTGERTVMVVRKGTLRTAYIKESASNKTLAGAERFLRGATP